MPRDQSVCGGDEKWAQFRFSVIGPLLAAPPEAGELKDELHRLSKKKWCHPVTGEWTRFGASTIERWYYLVSRPWNVPSHSDHSGRLPASCR